LPRSGPRSSFGSSPVNCALAKNNTNSAVSLCSPLLLFFLSLGSGLLSLSVSQETRDIHRFSPNSDSAGSKRNLDQLHFIQLPQAPIFDSCKNLASFASLNVAKEIIDAHFTGRRR
jgi:hypothetical protein